MGQVMSDFQNEVIKILEDMKEKIETLLKVNGFIIDYLHNKDSEFERHYNEYFGLIDNKDKN
jgi:ribulose bisphosphate carboxylase small subunit